MPWHSDLIQAERKGREARVQLTKENSPAAVCPAAGGGLGPSPALSKRLQEIRADTAAGGGGRVTWDSKLWFQHQLRDLQLLNHSGPRSLRLRNEATVSFSLLESGGGLLVNIAWHVIGNLGFEPAILAFM